MVDQGFNAGGEDCCGDELLCFHGLYTGVDGLVNMHLVMLGVVLFMRSIYLRSYQ